MLALDNKPESYLLKYTDKIGVRYSFTGEFLPLYSGVINSPIFKTAPSICKSILNFIKDLCLLVLNPILI